MQGQRPIGTVIDAPRAFLAKWFDLASDQAEPAVIDEAIRAGVPFQGTNLWILICAIVVCSVGLNLNSAAVIIGAMLISPLMGPIMGIGYGAGVNDIALIRSAAKNLAVAVVFSLLASTAYFLVTPLSEARSEILARTSPAIWDVLIALFGGLAGIIGATRRGRGTVIPGVAIATALMPPLCTAGFGIATLQPAYVLGALYLFTINSVFIATATLVMVRVIRLPQLTLDEIVRTRTRRYIGAIVFLTGVPSVYLAYGLVQQEVFANRAEQFVAAAFPSERGTFVVGREIAPDVIRLTVVGEEVSDEVLFALEQSLPAHGLQGVRLEVIQSRRDEVDVASLRQQLTGDLYRDTLVALDEKTRQIAVLQAELESAREAERVFGAIVAELRASYPQIASVTLGSGTAWDGAQANGSVLLVVMEVTTPLSDADRARIEAWLAVRAQVPLVHLSTSVVPAPDAP